MPAPPAHRAVGARRAGPVRGCRVDGAWDEVFDATGKPHEHVRALHSALASLPSDDLDTRSAALASAFRDEGTTFGLSGEERPFPLDLVPRVIDGRCSGAGSQALDVVVEVTRLA